MTASFGDVTTEYLALRRDAGFITGVHDVVWVAGDDAVTFLDGLLSQSIADIPIGGGASSLLLAPQGKLRATLWVLRGVDRIGLVSDAGRGGIVLEDLTRFKLRVDADLMIEQRPIIDVWGPDAHRRLSGMDLAPPSATGWAEVDGRVVAGLPFNHAPLARYILIGVEVDELVRGGLSQIGTLAATAVRIEMGEPVMGLDIDERTIPHEANVIEASVDFTKGCYLGQELVARIESRGRVNRHLRGLRMSTDVLPPVGAEIFGSAGPVGTLSSVGESPELHRPVAMALLRREIEPGDEVEIRWEDGTVSATVTDLPFKE